MRIYLTPQRRDDTLNVVKAAGDQLTINGEVFDFGDLNPGDTIPAGVVPCDWIVGPVEHVDGHITLTLLLPHGAEPEPWQRFPEPLLWVPDGPVDLPIDTYVVREEELTDMHRVVTTTTYRWHQAPHVVTSVQPLPAENADTEETADVEA